MLRFFFTDSSQTAKNLAKGSLLTGLLLIGFGMLVFILRDIFAFIAAGIFFLAGFSAIGYAVRLFLASRSMNQNRGPGGYRENVQVRIDDDFDI